MMNPGLSECVVICEEEEEQTVGLAARLIGDLTVTSSDVFLLLLCPHCQYCLVSLMTSNRAQDQTLLCRKKVGQLKESVQWAHCFLNSC